MIWKRLAAIALLISTLPGCVTQAVYKDTVAKLEGSHDRILQLTLALEAAKRDAVTDIQSLQRERDRLGRELTKARHLTSQRQTELESSEYHLATERKMREQAESKVVQLEVQLEVAQGKLSHTAIEEDLAVARLMNLERERTRLLDKLNKARSRVKVLDALMTIDRQVSSPLGKGGRR